MAKAAGGVLALVLSLAFSGAAWAEGPAPGPARKAEFVHVAASTSAHELVDWVVATDDAGGRPFVVVDKVNATASAFRADGSLLGASPALVGLGRGDESPPGIGERKLSTIKPSERITPAGRFSASLGRNLRGEDIVWVDYAAAVSLHRVATQVRGERRLERLATPSPLDNRISYGCINVPAVFYDQVVKPIFAAGPAIVYVLPETRTVAEVFIRPGA